ncbi:MAG: metallophosphoesterase [Anaerosomatales bacterium]|nr:metallophosphoesterase [Anaerosomatales bacterium]MDT8434570.1 metallophosphoesterase [Anaerosomatales bacterium]
MSISEHMPWLFDTFRVGMLGVALAVPAVTLYGAAEARTLKVTSDVITSRSLPKEFDGTRIVFVADVHAGPYFGPNRMDKLVEQVNALDPDVLILGGDYVGGRTGGARTFYARAADFRARRAKVAVLGNHDVWEGSEEARRGFAEAGFALLEDDSVHVSTGDASIAVAGVSDLYTGDPDPEAAARGIAPETFSVLVSHNPDVFAGRLGTTAGEWDLALAGHTHAGQVTFFGTPAFVPSEHGGRYRTGWRDENGTPILVSNGVGTVTLPVRLFAQPEIHLITLHSK